MTMPFKTRLKPWICMLLLATLKTGTLWGQHADSTERSIKHAVIKAGWLQDWRGAATQWMNTSAGHAEVAGYVSVDRRLRIFRHHKFEMAVYRQPYYPDEAAISKCCLCRAKLGEGEMTVINGRWSIKKDTIYLRYKREGSYKYLQYSAYQESGDPTLRHPKAVRRCRSHIRQTYLWKDGKLCMAAATDICFK